MIRWDNVFGLLLVLLLGHLVLQGIEVLDAHGPALRNLYEELFSPELRPVFWLEVLALSCAVVFRLWRSARHGIEDHALTKKGIDADAASLDSRGLAKGLRNGTRVREILRPGGLESCDLRPK